MRIIFLSVLFQLALFRAFSQLDSTSHHILETLIRDQYPKGTIYYTDGLGKSRLSGIKRDLNERMFTMHYPGFNDTLYLSAEEKKYLAAEFRKLQSAYWPDSLFYNSKRIPTDSMWAHISEKFREFSEAYQKDTSEEGRNKSSHGRIHYGSYTTTFQFSPIIFLRNKTIFLVYILRLCGSICGEEELIFYKLVNGKYKKWIVAGGGAF